MAEISGSVETTQEKAQVQASARQALTVQGVEHECKFESAHADGVMEMTRSKHESIVQVVVCRSSMYGSGR